MAPLGPNPFATKWKPSLKEAGLMRAYLGGGLWSPSRLAKCYYRGTGSCPRCGASPCDMYHIVHECSSLDAHRQQYMSHICTDGLPMQARDSMLWSSGLVSRSCFPPLPPRDCTGHWHIQYRDPQGITGNIYTDGACQ
eukprot:9452078-Pyramimonas_sp.AAC.1